MADQARRARRRATKGGDQRRALSVLQVGQFTKGFFGLFFNHIDI